MVVAAVVEIYRMDSAPSEGFYDDVDARENISPCQNINDYNPYAFQKVIG